MITKGLPIIGRPFLLNAESRMLNSGIECIGFRLKP
jgi:hypothetical protein